MPHASMNMKHWSFAALYMGLSRSTVATNHHDHINDTRHTQRCNHGPLMSHANLTPPHNPTTPHVLAATASSTRSSGTCCFVMATLEASKPAACNSDTAASPKDSPRPGGHTTTTLPPAAHSSPTSSTTAVSNIPAPNTTLDTDGVKNERGLNSAIVCAHTTSAGVMSEVGLREGTCDDRMTKLCNFWERMASKASCLSHNNLA